jgi:hypothetical protein
MQPRRADTHEGPDTDGVRALVVAPRLPVTVLVSGHETDDLRIVVAGLVRELRVERAHRAIGAAGPPGTVTISTRPVSLS